MRQAQCGRSVLLWPRVQTLYTREVAPRCRRMRHGEKEGGEKEAANGFSHTFLLTHVCAGYSVDDPSIRPRRQSKHTATTACSVVHTVARADALQARTLSHCTFAVFDYYTTPL